MPATYDLADVAAIKALHDGIADASQQRRALVWIVKVAAATDEEPFRSDADGGDRETAYAAGRAFVGRQIRKMVDLPAPVLEAMRKSE